MLSCRRRSLDRHDEDAPSCLKAQSQDEDGSGTAWKVSVGSSWGSTACPACLLRPSKLPAGLSLRSATFGHSLRSQRNAWSVLNARIFIPLPSSPAAHRIAE